MDTAPKIEKIVEQPDRNEPHIIFISHRLSRQMKAQLEKEQRTIHQFMAQRLTEYLDEIEKERQDTEKYTAYSEMQLFEPKL